VDSDGADDRLRGALPFQPEVSFRPTAQDEVFFKLGDTVGGFLRVGRQDDDAAVPFNAIYSGGVDIRGRLWGRAQDNIGLAYAYLNGGSLDIDHTHLAEAYVRFVLNDYFTLTADLQYMKDRLKGGGGPEGFIPGLRLVATF